VKVRLKPLPIFSWASVAPAYSPAATAANIAAPSAQACSEATTWMGTFITSAVTCMTNGDFWAMPPSATTRSARTPRSKRSMMAREPKAVASTRARNRRGAVLPRVRPATAPFRLWSASGERLPFSQSRASRPASPGARRAASSLRLASRRSLMSCRRRSFCAGSLGLLSAYSSGQYSRLTNQA
jgi:hypothetical protein